MSGEFPGVRYGFFSDVHGDLGALQRALGRLRDVDRCFFLGDVAGGREVDACCELLMQRGIAGVVGNHDLWEFELAGLQPGSLELLRGLPRELAFDDFLAVHSDYEGERFHYVHAESDAVRAFGRFPQRLVFFGHTHLSQVHELRADGGLGFYKAKPGLRHALRQGSRYLVNVGAANDGVVVYDAAEQALEYRGY